MEYFVFEGDELWNCSDDELVALGTKELATIGLVEPSDVEAGYVVRMPKAYPVYDDVYRDNVDVLRRWFEEHAPNVHPVGRNGMHKYNNQDHSMYTAMLTVENIHGAHHDIWSVNVEEEYHEEHDTGSGAASSGTGRHRAGTPRKLQLQRSARADGLGRLPALGQVLSSVRSSRSLRRRATSSARARERSSRRPTSQLSRTHTASRNSAAVTVSRSGGFFTPKPWAMRVEQPGEDGEEGDDHGHGQPHDGVLLVQVTPTGQLDDDGEGDQGAHQGDDVDSGHRASVLRCRLGLE